MQIDRDGRLLIPQFFRDRYGSRKGTSVMLVDTGIGVLVTSNPPVRRFVKHGKVTAVDTGVGAVDASVFSDAVSDLRVERDFNVRRASVTSIGEE